MNRGYLLGTVTTLFVMISGMFAPVYAVNVFNTVCSSQTARNSSVCRDQRQQSSAKGNPNVFIAVLKDVINILSFIVGAAAIIMLIISGLKMVLSNGDTKAASQARTGVGTALAGVVVVSIAQAFVVFVLDKIG